MNIDQLDTRIRNSIFFVSSVYIVALAAYIIRFWIIHGANISTTTESWGQLGDFIGGILNPVIAFFAFYWLATSVLLQKTELAATRDALMGTQKAQEEQAKTTLTSTKLQYINIQLEAINTQLLAERSYINQLIQQAQVHGSLYTVITRTGDSEKLNKILPNLNAEIDSLSCKRNKLIDMANSIAPDLA